MNASYSKLKGLLRERCIDAEYLARKIGLSTAASVYYRLSGKTPWRVNEMYAVLDMCKIPHDQLHIYFPKDGKSVIEPKLHVVDTKTA